MSGVPANVFAGTPAQSDPPKPEGKPKGKS